MKKTAFDLFNHRYKKGQKFSWLEMIDFALAYATQSTLDRDKVMGVVKEKMGERFDKSWAKDLTDTLCSLGVPEITEEEIEKMAEKKYPLAKDVYKNEIIYGIMAKREGFVVGAKAIIKELTKPKE